MVTVKCFDDCEWRILMIVNGVINSNKCELTEMYNWSNSIVNKEFRFTNWIEIEFTKKKLLDGNWKTNPRNIISFKRNKRLTYHLQFFGLTDEKRFPRMGNSYKFFGISIKSCSRTEKIGLGIDQVKHEKN